MNNLQIGGVNLFIYKNISNYAAGSLSPLAGFYSLSNYKITATNQPLVSFLPGIQFNTGGQLKFKISGKSSLGTIIAYYKCLNASEGVVQEQANVACNPVNGKFELTIIVPAGTVLVNLGLGSPASANYWVDEIKIESGDKATAFSLSLEDVDADATAKANAAQSTAEAYALAKAALAETTAKAYADGIVTERRGQSHC